jgi:hypothetical protein
MSLHRKQSPYAVRPELIQELEKQWEKMDDVAIQNQQKSAKKQKIGWLRWVRRITISISLSMISIIGSIIFFPRFCVYFFHQSYGAYPSILLAAGSVLFSLLFLYFLIQFILIRKFIWSTKVNGALILIICGYLLYGLLFLNNANIKDASIKETYLNLHPILRIGLTTAILADTDLIVTNTQRTKQDYKKWGLSPREQSLHYIQEETGFVHAVDLRTKGRSAFRNKVVELGFKIMGFNTLRHVGTADHLHISLPVNP